MQGRQQKPWLISVLDAWPAYLGSAVKAPDPCETEFRDKTLALITLDQVRKHMEGIEEDRFPGAARSTRSTLKPIMAFALEDLTARTRRAFAHGDIRSACVGCSWRPLRDRMAGADFTGCRVFASRKSQRLA